MDKKRTGLVLVNTGDGKGKTTAAMGTALRAVGNAMRVLMLQFIKSSSWRFGEQESAKLLGDRFVLKQMGHGFVGVHGAEPKEIDRRMAAEAWEEGRQAILSGAWDLVVLDEINCAIHAGLLAPEPVVEALRARPVQVHVILTGRNAHPLVIEAADTVTEMREIKHAYQKGVQAQRGIEY